MFSLKSICRALLVIAPITETQALPIFLFNSIPETEAKSKIMSSAVGFAKDLPGLFKETMSTALSYIPNPKKALQVSYVLSGINGWLAALIEKVEKDMSMHHPEHRGKLTAFSNRWMSFFGTDSGLTGLMGDGVKNYVGRMPFDAVTGDLMDSMNALRIFIPSRMAKRKTPPTTEQLLKRLRNFFNAAFPLLKRRKGAVFNLIKDVNDTVATNGLAQSTIEHFLGSEDVKVLLEALETEVKKEMKKHTEFKDFDKKEEKEDKKEREEL